MKVSNIPPSEGHGTPVERGELAIYFAVTHPYEVCVVGGVYYLGFLQGSPTRRVLQRTL